MVYDRRRYEAISIGEFIVEGHSEEDAATEFRINVTTVRRRLKALAYIDDKLFIRAMSKIHKRK